MPHHLGAFDTRRNRCVTTTAPERRPVDAFMIGGFTRPSFASSIMRTESAITCPLAGQHGAGKDCRTATSFARKGQEP